MSTPSEGAGGGGPTPPPPTAPPGSAYGALGDTAAPAGPPPTPAAVGAPATWGQRAGAFAIDFAIVFGVGFALTFVGGFVFGVVVGASGGTLEPYLLALNIASLVAYLVVYFAYTALTMRRAGPRNGQTFGKQALDIRVAHTDGEPVGVGLAARRELLMKGIVFGVISVVTLFIATLLDYLWPLWDKQDRAVHDMTSSTRVLRA